MLHIHDHYKSVTAYLHSASLYRTALIIAILMVVLQYFQDELMYQRDAIAKGQWWRLWTGNFVHTNHWHLVLNLAGYGLVMQFAKPWLNSKHLLFSISWLATCVGLGLWWFSPTVAWYMGFSGILYGLFLLVGFYSLLHKDWILAILILGGVCGKTWWDSLHAENSLSSELINAPVVYAAHLYGMIGALCLVFVWFRHLRSPPL